MTSLDQAAASPSAGIADAGLWRELADAVAKMERVVYDDPRIEDDVTRAEGLRYLTRLIAGGIALTMENWDWRNPQLLQFLSTTVQFGLPAADCHYQTAAVHGDHTYRITGYRGTSRMFDVETRQGHMAHLANWPLVDRRSEFDVAPDGTLEVVLSRDEQPGNWIRLAEGPGSIIVRQYYYDWLTEQPARLRIDRDGAEYPAPPLSAEAIEERAQLLLAWLRGIPGALMHAVGTYYEAPAGEFAFASLDYGWADLQYGKGVYRCEPEEAVIVELTPPEAPYWQIQLCSHFWEARDWHMRQSSINGHQAALDDDGVFRAVIARTDPGVQNWLDPGDLGTGLVTVRYYKATSIPQPTMRTVRLDDLAAELPAATPRMSSQERAKSVRDRSRSVFRRLCD